MALIDKLKNLGNIIRDKTGGTELLTIEDMATEVSSLPVIKKGITWDKFDEEGWVTEATLYTTDTKIPDSVCESLTNTEGHFGLYNRLTSINVPSQISSIGEKAFMYCYMLPFFDFSNIEEIGKQAFMGCENLELTDFPPKLKQLQGSTFSDCPKVSFSELPNGVVYGSSACSGMTGLTNVKLPSEMTAIPNYCFASCSNLVSVEFAPNTLSLGTWCFSNCSKLALTELPPTLITISERAFWKTPALEISKIPASVQTIGKWAFMGCAKMTTLTFEGTPTSLDAAVFYNCNNLTTINVPWSEGEVANAPWGATKATINYNYMGN